MAENSPPDSWAITLTPPSGAPGASDFPAAPAGPGMAAQNNMVTTIPASAAMRPVYGPDKDN
jgi:hypothetical protein